MSRARVRPDAADSDQGPAFSAVCAAISENGGWLAFDRFLDIALHDPHCGYYGAGHVRLGVDGDFATAPLLSPLFAGCVAAQIRDVLRETGGGVLELGAGDGRLARDISRILSPEGILPQYEILETSPALRARQQTELRGEPGNFCWRDTLPEKFCGAVFANETLDAIPFRLFVRREGKWLERGVALGEGGLIFCDRQTPPDLATARLDETGAAGGERCRSQLAGRGAGAELGGKKSRRAFC